MQNPINFLTKNSQNRLVPLQSDAIGAVSYGTSLLVMLNVTANTVVKTGKGRIAKINVITPGSSAGGLYDATTVGGISAANQFAVVPNSSGIINLDFPFFNGLVYVPGTGETASIAYI